MKAVVLAAGLCTRIRPVANGLPKCLLPFGGRAILDFQIDSLFDAGIEALAIVVGYGKEHIIQYVAEQHPEKCGSINFIVNPRFATTNNIYSLWLAKQWIGQSDFIALNADVLYDPRILQPAVATRADVSMIIDEEFREETMKVIIRQGTIAAMGKMIPREQASGTYIGVTTFSRGAVKPLFAAIAELIDKGRVNVFFNVAVEKLIASGMHVYFTKTGGLPWAEIDDASDLRYAEAHVYSLLDGPFYPVPAAPGALGPAASFICYVDDLLDGKAKLRDDPAADRTRFPGSLQAGLFGPAGRAPYREATIVAAPSCHQLKTVVEEDRHEYCPEVPH